MNKLLVRIIAGLVTIALLLGLFGFTFISLANKVRFDHYWTDFVAPALNYLHEQPELLAVAPFEALSAVPIKSDRFGAVFRARINAGQVVFEREKNALLAWRALNRDLLLQVTSDRFGHSFYELYLWIVQREMGLSTDQESTLQRLNQKLGISIHKLSDSHKLSSQRALDQLYTDGVYIEVGAQRAFALLRSGSGQIYELVYPRPFSSFSWMAGGFLFVSAVALLTLIIYLTLLRFDRRLRNIETVASRIARGELDARVRKAGDLDAVSRLGKAFNSMADHIQRLMYVQKEMIHAVSHELRTPVARIRFGVQMIEDCPSQEAVQKQVKDIDGDIQELDELIDEILTYARLEQGGPILTFHESDIAEIVRQVVGEQSSVKPDMEIYSDFSAGSDQWVHSEVEARYIHRSIQNLVGNATRYAKSSVRVSCHFDAETCRVDVEDDGPGIPEDQWESVFTPFARLDDSRTRSSGGYGLGLSIVRRILFWHGGQAFLGRSADLGGAKFSLVWPRKQPSSDAAQRR